MGSTMPPGLWLGQPTLQALLVAAVLAVAAAAAAGPGPSNPDSPAKQCCAPGLTLLRHKHHTCSDGSRLALECGVMFILDWHENEDDAYELLPDGTLLIDSVAIKSFCLARMPGGVVGDTNASHEVALVCHREAGLGGDVGDEPDPRPEWWFQVAAALSWLSVVCLALTLAAHLALPELRDLQGRCHMGAVASLGLGLLVLAVLQSATRLEGALCTTMAFLVYYWLLSAFFWLNVTSFNVWRSVVLERVRFREGTLLATYCAASWGGPLVLLLALLAAHLLPEGPDDAVVRPRFGANKCWFHDDRATWAWFYWPLAVLLGLNVIYFVWTTAHLWRQYGGGRGGAGRSKLLRQRLLLSLKLFLIMGISWIFELISSAADVPGNVAWYLTDTFNAMQGVVILVVLVLTRRRVWRALHRRQPCGLRPPAAWAFPPGDLGEHVDDGCVTSDSEDDEEADNALAKELTDMSASPGDGVHAAANGQTNGTNGQLIAARSIVVY